MSRGAAHTGAAAAAAVGVDVAQALPHVGRVSATDDITVDTIGAALGRCAPDTGGTDHTATARSATV